MDEVARLFDVHRTTLLRWRHLRAAGELAPPPRPGRSPKIGPGDLSRLVAQVTTAPDATLREHCAAWQVVTGVPVSEATMCRARRRVRWTLNKEPDCHRTERGGAGGLARRRGAVASGGSPLSRRDQHPHRLHPAPSAGAARPARSRSSSAQP
ncbi:MAG: hypothetical protein ACJ789_02265 [Thermomicrobiales bacterium]